MISGKFKVNFPGGLHLRPAGILCEQARQDQCCIHFLYCDGSANAKSVLSVLGACVRCGDEITLECDGADEEKAFADLSDLLQNRMGDENVEFQKV